jgi:fructokinase
MDYLLGIEAGGTKFFVSIGNDKGEVVDRTRIDTTTPEETMPQVLAAMRQYEKEHGFRAIGVGCFGPLDPNPLSPTYGSITDTPKLPWQNYPILDAIKAEFSAPIAFDTDVNAALLCECYWGHGLGLQDVIYVTIGTGIGAGVMAGGRVLHGTHHTEIGHMFVPRSKREKDYAGCCPFHGDCLEGLASGPSIKERWGVDSALDLQPSHEAWLLEEEYLSYMVANLMYSFSPEKIVLGGGVMKQQHLFAEIHQQAAALINGYIRHATPERLAEIVVPASFGDNTGAKGALALALSAGT